MKNNTKTACKYNCESCIVQESNHNFRMQFRIGASNRN